MIRIVAEAESRVFIQRRNRARWSGRVMETVSSGNGARVTKTIEIYEVDRRIGVAEGMGGGGRVRNGGQTPVAGSRLLDKVQGCWAAAEVGSVPLRRDARFMLRSGVFFTQKK